MNLEPLSPEKYLAERVDDQLDWYNQKSTTNKNLYMRLQCFSLVAGSLIPLIALSFDTVEARIAVAIIGALTAIVSGLLSLFQYRDLWVDYRSTAELLKREKYLFLAKAAPYDASSAFPVFVNNVESILLSENSQWRERVLTDEPEPSLNKTPDQAET
ncbi:MAG: DUF4231 domain-containing protein [Granulosicoccus sp.]